MTIPHIEERKKLRALHDERKMLWGEMEQSLEPLRANLHEATNRAEEEYLAAGGVPMGKLMSVPMEHLKSEQQQRLVRERAEKEAPAREALSAAQAVFDERYDAIDERIAAVEKAIGSKPLDPAAVGDEDAVVLQCALTGHFILESRQDRRGARSRPSNQGCLTCSLPVLSGRVDRSGEG